MPPIIEEELTATYWESLDQMLARMDIISVNCPHTPATYHLLSARRLKLIRPEAYIVNTARGEVVDENALVRLISSGEIAGAGLDAHAVEPLPPDSPLLGVDNLVVTPHLGAIASDVFAPTVTRMFDNIARVSRGEAVPERDSVV